MLNYYGDSSSFETYNLRSVLNDQLPVDALRDKIVLVGSNALTVKNLLLTPYSRRLYDMAEPMSGVFIHANIIHQLLSGALDNRPMMTVYPSAFSYGALVVWVLVGSWLGRRSVTSVWMGTIALLSTCLALIGLSYLLFLQGLWISLVPAMLGFILSGILLFAVTNRQAEQLFLKRTTRAIMQHYPDNPAVTRIAVEYLRQGERQRQQQLVTAIEAKFLAHLDSLEKRSIK